MLVRRTVSIEDGSLQRVSAPQGVFFRNDKGDWARSELAAAELAGGEGSALRAEHVVATTAKQAIALLEAIPTETLKGKRDMAF